MTVTFGTERGGNGYGAVDTSLPQLLGIGFFLSKATGGIHGVSMGIGPAVHSTST